MKNSKFPPNNIGFKFIVHNSWEGRKMNIPSVQDSFVEELNVQRLFPQLMASTLTLIMILIFDPERQ
jgi:hypothetical protein